LVLFSRPSKSWVLSSYASGGSGFKVQTSREQKALLDFLQSLLTELQGLIGHFLSFPTKLRKEGGKAEDIYPVHPVNPV